MVTLERRLGAGFPQPLLGDLVELPGRHARLHRGGEFLEHPRDQRVDPRQLLDLSLRAAHDAHDACALNIHRAPRGSPAPPPSFFATIDSSCDAGKPSAEATADTSASRTCSGVCNPSIRRNVGRAL